MPESTKKESNNILWKEISGMLDKLIKHYFGADLDAVWQTIKEEIPILKKEIKKILKN